MSYKQGDLVYWLGLQGVVEDITEYGIQVKFLEASQRFKRPIERWVTFNDDGTYLSGQNAGLSKTAGLTNYTNPVPDYDLVRHLDELDSKITLMVDFIEDMVEKYKGEA